MPIGVRHIAVAILCLAAIPLSAQPDSVHVTLSGHVYGEAGNPVMGARIDLLPLDVGFSGLMPGAHTDKLGHFVMFTPAYGRTRVSASKISAGYPDTTGKLFSSENDSAVVVDLTADQPVIDVNIRLGPPDGIIRGRLFNKKDGNAVRLARILMEWADDPAVMDSEDAPGSGNFQYALPKHPITLTITAPGFKPWTYVNVQTGDKFLAIDSGERLSILVALEPVETSDSSQVK